MDTAVITGSGESEIIGEGDSTFLFLTEGFVTMLHGMKDMLYMTLKISTVNVTSYFSSMYRKQTLMVVKGLQMNI